MFVCFLFISYCFVLLVDQMFVCCSLRLIQNPSGSRDHGIVLTCLLYYGSPSLSSNSRPGESFLFALISGPKSRFNYFYLKVLLYYIVFLSILLDSFFIKICNASWNVETSSDSKYQQLFFGWKTQRYYFLLLRSVNIPVWLNINQLIAVMFFSCVCLCGVHTEWNHVRLFLALK